MHTNVLSAPMRQQPNAQVVAWLDNQHAESLWISSITLFEARYGLALLSPGQRKSLLQGRFNQMVQDDSENRVLPFDADAATQAAQLAAERKARGRPVDMRDALIADIAPAKRATLSTRNTRDAVRRLQLNMTVSRNVGIPSANLPLKSGSVFIDIKSTYAPEPVAAIGAQLWHL